MLEDYETHEKDSPTSAEVDCWAGGAPTTAVLPICLADSKQNKQPWALVHQGERYQSTRGNSANPSCIILHLLASQIRHLPGTANCFYKTCCICQAQDCCGTSTYPVLSCSSPSRMDMAQMQTFWNSTQQRTWDWIPAVCPLLQADDIGVLPEHKAPLGLGCPVLSPALTLSSTLSMESTQPESKALRTAGTKEIEYTR